MSERIKIYSYVDSRRNPLTDPVFFSLKMAEWYKSTSDFRGFNNECRGWITDEKYGLLDAEQVRIEETKLDDLGAKELIIPHIPDKIYFGARPVEPYPVAFRNANKALTFLDNRFRERLRHHFPSADGIWPIDFKSITLGLLAVLTLEQLKKLQDRALMDQDTSFEPIAGEVLNFRLERSGLSER